MPPPFPVLARCDAPSRQVVSRCAAFCLQALSPRLATSQTLSEKKESLVVTSLACVTLPPFLSRDAGMASPDHTPKGRGYDTSILYFHHANGASHTALARCMN